MILSQLRDGAPFVTRYTHRAGKLLARSGGSALVEWTGDGSTRTIHGHDRSGNPVERTFTAGAKRETISLGTEVAQ